MEDNRTAATSGGGPGWPGWPRAVAACLRFYSRLPVPLLSGETHGAPDFRSVPRALPLASVLIALPAAALLAGAAGIGLPPLVAAGLSLAVLAATTGALHEDGLADSVDGLFGGRDREHRLAIMKDSRVGSYGALALAFSVLLRIAALAAVAEGAGALAAAAALMAAAVWSRADSLRIVAFLPPARPDGAAAAVGRPSLMTIVFAMTLAGLLALVTAPAGLTLPGLVLGCWLAWLSTSGVGALARRLIGGQTGDIVGAAQQCGELAVYLGILVAMAWQAG